MKKQYENLALVVVKLDAQDVITSSVYIEWDTQWNGSGNQTDGWVGNIFG